MPSPTSLPFVSHVLELTLGKNHASDNRDGIVDLDLLAVYLLGLVEIVFNGDLYLDLAALAGNLLGGHLFAVEEVSDVDFYRQLFVALAAVIEVSRVHMPGDAAVFADGFDVALDIGDIFQRACVADLDLTLVGMEPVGDGDILDIAAVVHVDIHGLALLHGAGHIGVIYRRGLLIAGRRGSVAVVAGALAGAHGEYARRESEAERRFENKVFLHFIALLVQAFALRLLRSF